MEQEFVKELIKELILTRQKVISEGGISYETSSIFERLLDRIEQKFQIEENLIPELQVGFREYYEKNKEKAYEKLIDILIKKIGGFSAWEIKNLIEEKMSSRIAEEILTNPEVARQLKIAITKISQDLGNKLERKELKIKLAID